jgi:hypothetical protein
MTDLDAPITKRDLLEFREELRHEIEKLGVEIEKLGVKIDSFWTASMHVERLAFGVLALGTLAIVAMAVVVILRAS